MSDVSSTATTSLTSGTDNSGSTLSDAARHVWAKTGGQTHWLPLEQHLEDSRLMAELLYDRWLPRQVKERWERLETSPGSMRRLAVFLAATHDVGKAAPAFAAQSATLVELARQHGLASHTKEELRDDRLALPHALISQLAATDWWRSHGLSEDDAIALASVLGAHHGRPVPDAPFGTAAVPRDEGLGREAWAQIRREFLDVMAERTGVAGDIAAGQIPLPPLPVLVELSGLVIVADWLASNTELHPLFELGTVSSPVTVHQRSDVAWHRIDFPSPWHPSSPTQDVHGLYRARFQWDTNTSPHAAQRTTAELARRHDVGMLFLETSTGGGKTEASLVAAEIIAAARGSQGIIVALPTQATTNAMFGRVASWIENLPSPPQEVSAWALSLGHGRAHLNPAFAELVDQVRYFEASLPNSQDFAPMGDEQDRDGRGEPNNAVAHPWFLGAKRRLLANFSVVTIDQILMAALQRRHLMLAHTALSGKVVIIDEAHASDSYMNVYLDSALSWLGAYEVPVIVLSATLTPRRRREMIAAYAPHRNDEVEQLTIDPAAYPLVTLVPRDDKPIQQVLVAETSPGREVEWAWMADDISTIVSRVMDAIADGGCALVIRNTVRDAQATAEAFAQAGVTPILNHASFMAVDRAANDERLRILFGKQVDERPRQAVVVATQVVEQSLDIDFDLVVSDLAPMDLLIQRIGRLHRHQRVRPSGLAHARIHLLATVAGDQPPQASTGSVAVYGEHPLLRTAATLLEHGTRIRIPEDVALLVYRALGEEPVGPTVWADRMELAADIEARKQDASREKAKVWCLPRYTHRSGSELGEWQVSSNDGDETAMAASVRDSQPTLEVIVVPLLPDGEAAIRPPWLTNDDTCADILDTSTLPSDDLAREIATWTVRLPTRLTRWTLDACIKAIDSDPRTKRWAWRSHVLLKGELFLPMLLAAEATALTTQVSINDTAHTLRYSPQRGLEVEDA